MFYAVEHGDFVVFCCRTPHGVRGLKFWHHYTIDPLYAVAPRMGCVD